MARWDSTDGDDLLTYNALDTCATARVHRELLKEPDWKSPRCQKLHAIHVEMSKMGAELHSTGFKVIAANRAKLITELTDLSEQRHRELVRHIGARKNPAFQGTDGDMRALLYERHAKEGINCYQIPEPEPWDKVMWTNDQCTSLAVDKEALLRIFIDPGIPEEVRDCISLFWRAKAPNKALSTWVGAVNSQGEPSEVQQRIGPDGRFRADWNSAGTETMRWASELMTIPEAKDESTMGGQLPNIRTMYGCEKGNVLYHWDWSQQELWMQYAINGDEALGAALRTGDVYSDDARSWFPTQLEAKFGPEWRTVNLKDKWPNGRRQCKVGHLACMYLATPPAIWTQGLIQDRTMKFSFAKWVHGVFHAKYHRTIQYAEEELEFARRHHYSEGRILQGRRYYPPTVGQDGELIAHVTINEACNFPVQRTAGEMGALAMLAIRDKLVKYKVKAKILTNEHDAGTLELRDNPTTRKDVEAIVLESVTGPWTIRGNQKTVTLPFKAKGKFGYTWAESCAD